MLEWLILLVVVCDLAVNLGSLWHVRKPAPPIAFPSPAPVVPFHAPRHGPVLDR